uniref:Prosaposin variant B-like protein n=1 Tax=Triatoma infestans TaxID=30076 RepID=A0A161MKW7_TRIIF
MPAFIALLANRIDPSQVCPNLGICPSTLVAVKYEDKPTCPLCLLAIEATPSKISNKTELEINDALDDLCIRDVFPNTLSTECVKFITDYRNQITDMIIAEFTAQESCVYAELCKIPKHLSIPPVHEVHLENKIISAGNVETNEIVQNVNNPNVCILCEFVMSKLEQALKDKKTEEEIKDTVFKICNYMPKTITAQCKNFVQQYADFILDLLAQEMEPKEICTALNLCGKANLLLRSPIKRCLMCELLMDGLKTVLTEPEIEDNLNYKLVKACNYVPEDHIAFCQQMVLVMAPQIETALRTLPVGPLVCHRIHMCANEGARAQLIRMAGPKGKCFLGPDYWCKSTTTAAHCQEIEYCQKHVWRSDKPRRLIKKGSVIY